jgi:phosphoribosylformimino-5-aminoimidazole carboxamide ribotide isomerase
MVVIPASDIKGGQCVRLAQGDFNRVTVYGENPADVARCWQDLGAERIHVVDLDGSLAGSPQNRAAVKDIVRATAVPIELGGGIRDMATVAFYLEAGVRWIILGTAAIRDEDFAREACRAFPGQVILGIDASDGRVAVQGWTEQTSVTAVDLARRFQSFGIAAIVYTDILRDGMETGVNVEATRALADAIETPVIASGGVGGVGDIERLLPIEPSGVMGVIVGRALYTGALTLEQAMAAARGKGQGKTR